MNILGDLTDAADRAAVAQANFEKIETLLTIFLGLNPNDNNTRWKDGQFQVWDSVAAAADATKPWRALTAENGVPGYSDPIDD
ncbi:MAG: hypothetical protein JWM68_375 [Verrucomicrobiales bacterium]|nr:hypothetical protein [Verrucomicrobiales bacterium]